MQLQPRKNRSAAAQLYQKIQRRWQFITSDHVPTRVFFNHAELSFAQDIVEEQSCLTARKNFTPCSACPEGIAVLQRLHEGAATLTYSVCQLWPLACRKKRFGVEGRHSRTRAGERFTVLRFLR